MFGYAHPIFFGNAEIFADSIRKRVYASTEVPDVNGYTKVYVAEKKDDITEDDVTEELQQV